MKEFRLFVHDVMELTKARIVMLSMMMAMLGFALGSAGPSHIPTMVAMLVGLALVGASCGILNEYIERDIDAMMWRTMNRPIPSGRISPRTALFVGVITGVFGELVLLIGVNPITAILGATTLLFYVGIYTPSKRVSSLSTLIGAIPGAMPPLMGWTSSYGAIAPEGILLFAILFLWQIPHFLSIGWLYREDYGRANLPILSVIDTNGRATAKQVILYTLVLLPLTLLPTVWGITGRIYFLGALTLGLAFIATGMSLAVHRTKAYAKRLFLISIVYLPALGILMAWDRVF